MGLGVIFEGFVEPGSLLVDVVAENGTGILFEVDSGPESERLVYALTVDQVEKVSRFDVFMRFFWAELAFIFYAEHEAHY